MAAARDRARACAIAMAVATLVAASGCRQDMHDQPRYDPNEASRFFADGRTARPIPPGTVARGQLGADRHYTTGKIGDRYAETFPVVISDQLLRRGRERYDIYCSPCHDRTGSGNGMIVQRGYPRPASFHNRRLRVAPPGYYFHAISNGFGVMPSYKVQVPIEDRWAIIAYIRALQLSQNALLDEVEPVTRRLLEAQAEAHDE